MLTAAPPRGYEFLSSSQFSQLGAVIHRHNDIHPKKAQYESKMANRRVSLLDFTIWVRCSLNEAVRLNESVIGP